MFDRRRSVVHGDIVGEVRDGVASICYACSYPLLPDDLHSQSYEKGELSSLLSGFFRRTKKRFRERQAQYDRYQESLFSPYLKIQNNCNQLQMRIMKIPQLQKEMFLPFDKDCDSSEYAIFDNLDGE